MTGFPWSYVEVTADGSTDTFDITFPYIVQAHVHVSLKVGDADAVVVDDSTLVFPSNGQVQLDASPVADVVVRVYRTTPIDEPIVVYQAGVISATNLNTSIQQLLYAIQEATDAALTASTTNVTIVQQGDAFDVAVSVPWHPNNGEIVGAWKVPQDLLYKPSDADRFKIGSFSGHLTGGTSTFDLIQYSTADPMGTVQTLGTFTIPGGDDQGSYATGVGSNQTIAEGQTVALKAISVHASLVDVHVNIRLERIPA